jgi:F-type H+-transporting ATPase subunit b
MTIDWMSLGLQTVNVLVLIWLLNRFLFKPVTAIITKRQAAATAASGAATAAKAEADAAAARADAEAARLAAARRDLREEMAEDAAARRAEIIAAAKADAAELRATAETALEQDRRAAADQAEADATALALDIAARLMSRLPPDARIAGFIDGLAAAIAALPERDRAEIGANGAPVPLSAARALTGPEDAALRAALTGALGRELALEVTADPALLAGLELTAPHAVIRNHLRADLARVKAELTRHDR